MHQNRPLLSGSFGMTGSTHWLASATAMSVLERGGNAFDAAAAGGFVLQVVEPHLNGPGGEVPIVLWSERDQQVQVVCGQGVAPAAATIEAFEQLGIDEIPGAGLLAATVPGAFGGWLLMLERWGTWSLRDVLSYAIGYARNGYPAIPGICSTVEGVAEMFAHGLADLRRAVAAGRAAAGAGLAAEDSGARGHLRANRRGGRAKAADREGRIAAARAIWYDGFVAEALGRFSTGTSWRDPTGELHSGLLTADDMSGWQPTVEQPATYDYGRYTVCKTQAWGQGPVFLAQLALLSGFDLDGMGHLSADYLHTVVECSKLAFADREAWYGDAPGVEDLHHKLVDESYVASSARAGRRTRPASSSGPARSTGAPRCCRARSAVASAATGPGLGDPTVRTGEVRRGDTCHIDVVDRDGNLVSATPSGGWLDSSPHITELGFCLGSRAQMFWLQPGLPSSLRPGTRPRTTLTPSLALRDGEPWMAFGTPGGDQQDQWSLAFFLAVVHGGLDLQAAIEAPCYHSDHFPSSFAPRVARPGVLAVEDRLGAVTIDELRRRGHEIEDAGAWALGRMSAVAREGAVRLGAANPRGVQGYACGR